MTGAEIVPLTPYAIDPARGALYNRETGEALSLADADEQTLAVIDEQVRAMRDFFRDATTVVDEELKARADAQNTKTLDVGTHMVQIESKREWDPDATWDGLQQLAEAGLISEADIDNAMPQKVTRKPDGRKLNSILTDAAGKNPEAAQALARARSERRYVKLARTSVDAEAVEA